MYRFSALIQDFVYEAKDDDLTSIPSGGSVVWDLDNNGDLNQTVTATIRRQRENYNSWSFSESHERTFLQRIEKNRDIVKVLAKIFRVSAAGSQGTSITKEWSTNETRIEETRREEVDITEVSLAAQITIPPKTRATYKVIWHEVNERVPFKATVKISGLADRSRKSGAIEPMAQVDKDAIMYFLEESGFDGKIVGEEGNFVLAEIKGFIEINGAIKGQLVLDFKEL
jgi:hypothetical protein